MAHYGWYLLVVALLYVSGAVSSPVGKTMESRIIGGSNAERSEFPFQISLWRNGKPMCSGSILNNVWVVTASHCVDTSLPYQLIVIAGMLNQNESHPDVQISGVKRIIIHPDYHGVMSPNDIALLQLNNRLKWTSAVQTIELPMENQEFVGYAWIAGWGRIESAIAVPSRTLQKIQMEIWPFNICANNLISAVGHYNPLDATMICVGPIAGTGSVCKGDSGGPLVQNGKLLGVTSWTLMPCGRERAPSVYTKVSKFVAFIRQYVTEV